MIRVHQEVLMRDSKQISILPIWMMMNRVYMDHNIHFAAAVIAVRRIEIILIIVGAGDCRFVRGKWEIFNCFIPLKLFKFNYCVSEVNIG